MMTGYWQCIIIEVNCLNIIFLFILLDSSSEESITQFAEHFKLQNTLQYLSGGASVGDLPVQLPKVNSF